MKKKLQLKVGRQRISVPLNEIIFFEKEKRKIIVHSLSDNISFYGKFEDVLLFLDERFNYPHKSYIFNMDYILRLGLSEIVLEGGTKIIMGRKCFARCTKTFDGYVAKRVAKGRLL